MGLGRGSPTRCPRKRCRDLLQAAADAPEKRGRSGLPVAMLTGLGSHCPASRSGRSPSRSWCRPGAPGWEIRLTASDPDRPSSADQLWTAGQSRCPSPRSRFAGEVSQGHGGDGGVAVQDPARQPGHLPEMLTPGRLAGGVSSLVAGHRGVVDGQGHGSASRSGSGSRVRAGLVPRSSAREGAGRAASRGAGRRRSRTRGGAASGRGRGGRRGRRSRACPSRPGAGRGRGGGRLGGGGRVRGVSCRVWSLAASLSAARLGCLSGSGGPAWPWCASGALLAAWSVRRPSGRRPGGRGGGSGSCPRSLKMTM